LEIQYSDVVDVLVPAWGAGRRLVVKCKNVFYTFEILNGVAINREKTYDFYRLIAQKSGVPIPDEFQKKEREYEKPEGSKAPPPKEDSKTAPSKIDAMSVDDRGEVWVMVWPDGRFYHISPCPAVKFFNGQNMKLKDAEKSGYKPCSQCIK